MARIEKLKTRKEQPFFSPLHFHLVETFTLSSIYSYIRIHTRIQPLLYLTHIIPFFFSSAQLTLNESHHHTGGQGIVKEIKMSYFQSFM